MINIYEQVDRNKRRSMLVVIGFFVFVVLVGWALYYLFGFGPEMVVLAFFFAIVSSFAGYWWGDRIVLTAVGARPASRMRDFKFYTVAENLSIATGLPKPKLYVINSPALNAFATGRDPDHAVICVTTGLLENLNRTELEGVIAHELSHIKDYDTRLMTIVSVLVGMVILLSDWLLRASFFGGRKEDREKGGLLALVGLLTILLSPIIARFIQLAISRRREFLADAQAVKITRFPEGLARALEKISKDSRPLKSASGATAHLFIANPFKGKKTFNFFSNLFSTHPPVEERIKALREMK